MNIDSNNFHLESTDPSLQTKRYCNSDKPFNVVITDLGMPNVDGRKVTANVKALSPSTPVILLTGWGQRFVAEGDVPPHVDNVLNKPPKLHDLREALASLAVPQA